MSKVKKSTQKAAAPVSDAQVYCGPSIKGVVHQFTVFEGGLPENLKAIVDRKPTLAALIVPVDQFAAFKTELNTPGSSAYFIYQNIIKSFTRG